MKKKHRIFKICIGIITIIVAFQITVWVLFDIRLVLFSNNHSLENTYKLDWNSKYNLKQKDNTCGAHAVMAVISVEKEQYIDPYFIYDSIPEKLGRGYVYPWGLTRHLKRHGIRMHSSFLGFLSRGMRIGWLENKIEDKHPVIVIVGTRRYLHYITVLGYSEKSFFIYDSEINGDTNKEEPGNITIPKNEVINHMGNAYFSGIYLNMAISY